MSAVSELLDKLGRLSLFDLLILYVVYFIPISLSLKTLNKLMSYTLLVKNKSFNPTTILEFLRFCKIMHFGWVIDKVRIRLKNFMN